jgi:hypothetical protein
MLKNINEIIDIFNVSPVILILLVAGLSIRCGISELTHDPEKLITRFEKLIRIERRTKEADWEFKNRRRPRATLFPIYVTERSYGCWLAVFTLCFILTSPLKIRKT